MTEKELTLKVVDLRTKGVSYSKIAKELNIDKQKAVDIAKENEGEIVTLQAIQNEAYYKAKHIDAEGRLDSLCALYEKIRDELEKRDLSEIPTKELIALHLKTLAALKVEVTTPPVKSSAEQQREAQDRAISLF